MNENNTMLEKAVIILVNIAGIACLVYFGVPFIMHDTSVSNPYAMIPAERWDGCGTVLMIGLVPMFAANMLGFKLVLEKTKPICIRAMFFLPLIIELGLVVYYFILLRGM